MWFNEGGQEGCGLMKEGGRGEKPNQNRGCGNSCLKKSQFFFSDHTFLNCFFTLFNSLCMYIFLILLDLSNFISKKHLFWPQRGMQGGKHIHSEL